jgi:hypothetical protein
VDYYRQQIDLATVSGSKTTVDDSTEEENGEDGFDWDDGDDGDDGDDEGGTVIF